MTAPLRHVLVGVPTTTGDFAAAGWRQPDPELLRAQHESFCELLSELGAEVTVLPSADGLVDACYVYDPVFVTGGGQIVLEMPKPVRVPEPERLSAALVDAGVPVAGRLEGDARADGGDMFWLDDRSLAVARGYRTNAEAHRQLAEILAREGVELVRADLPHHRGAESLLHLLSVVSPIAEDLAAVFEPLAPIPLLEELDARGTERIRVDEDEWETLACNLLAVRPGVVVMANGNPRTRRSLEAAGVDVHVYAASELNKGDGGPTCLTRPILRA